MDPKARFDGRGAMYHAYRPGYPPEVATTLRQLGVLGPATVIADLGSGTGKLTELFLEHSAAVYGVEPNADMRVEAEKTLRSNPRFVSVAGSAERTGLPAASVDLVLCGQSLHWFDNEASHAECKRILRAEGSFCALWNDRRTEGSFASAYEQALRETCPEYKARTHKIYDRSKMTRWIQEATLTERCFAYSQDFKLEPLLQRALTASYVPREGPIYEAAMSAIQQAFEEHAVNGVVTLEYDTRLFVGRITDVYPTSA